ncbi:MAG: hypothetical protein KAJ60_11190 [Desulfobulbaceae bacterium]|nr:hypothetical protein [Desulfobulbaceae bacterium]
MLYFCEDCGARNILSEKEVTLNGEGRVNFRCSSCKYLNKIGSAQAGAPHPRQASTPENTRKKK